MKSVLYILDASGRPTPEPDCITWAQWYADANEQRRVARTPVGDVEVSTVFLGVDHSYDDDGPPILWETMVFPECVEKDRCSGNREQAEAMHSAMVEKLKALK